MLSAPAVTCHASVAEPLQNAPARCVERAGVSCVRADPRNRAQKAERRLARGALSVERSVAPTQRTEAGAARPYADAHCGAWSARIGSHNAPKCFAVPLDGQARGRGAAASVMERPEGGEATWLKFATAAAGVCRGKTDRVEP